MSSLFERHTVPGSGPSRRRVSYVQAAKQHNERRARRAKRKAASHGKTALTPSEVYQQYLSMRTTDRFKAWKRNQWLRQHGVCYYCEGSLRYRRVNVEHIKPISKGGTNGWANLVLACASCNKQKGSTPLEDSVRTGLKTRYLDARHNWSEELERQAQLGLLYRQNF